MDTRIIANQLAERMGQVEKLKEELKSEREMLKSEIENSQAYQDATKELEQIRLKRKMLIEQNNIVIDLTQKIKESAEELKEIKEILSAELVSFFKENEAPEFETESGAIYKIEVTAKAKQTNQPNLFGGANYGN